MLRGIKAIGVIDIMFSCCMWNLAKTGGWEAYEKITGEKADKLNNIMDEKETSIEEKMDKFQRLHDKIKFRAFGKVQIKENIR